MFCATWWWWGWKLQSIRRRIDQLSSNTRGSFICGQLIIHEGLLDNQVLADATRRRFYCQLRKVLDFLYFGILFPMRGAVVFRGKFQFHDHYLDVLPQLIVQPTIEDRVRTSGEHGKCFEENVGEEEKRTTYDVLADLRHETENVPWRPAQSEVEDYCQENFKSLQAFRMKLLRVLLAVSTFSPQFVPAFESRIYFGVEESC